MLNFNTQQLYSFWIVAQEGSITRACRRLCLAQPTISVQIIQLEKTLKMPLFMREKNRLSLTNQGHLVFEHANAIFGAVQELNEALKDGLSQGAGKVRIGMDSGITHPVALRCLQAVQEIQQSKPILLLQGSFHDMLRRLRDREVDFLCSDKPAPSEGNRLYRNIQVGRLPVFFAAVPEFARRCEVFPRDLSKVPLILPVSSSPLRAEIDHYLAEVKIQTWIVGEVSDADFMRRLALDGLGAAPLHMLAAAGDLRAGRLVRLGRRPTGLVKTIWLIARTGEQNLPAVQQVFKDFRL